MTASALPPSADGTRDFLSSSHLFSDDTLSALLNILPQEEIESPCDSEFASKVKHPNVRLPSGWGTYRGHLL